MQIVELSACFRRAVIYARPQPCFYDSSQHVEDVCRKSSRRFLLSHAVSTHRAFSTHLSRRAEESNTIIAAAPVDFDTLDPGNSSLSATTKGIFTRIRVVPASPSYFTGQPDFTDNLLSVRAVLRKYQTIPTVKPIDAPRVAWRTLSQYRVLVGEPVRASRYRLIVSALQRLNQIHPALMPDEVRETMAYYKRDIDPFANRPTPEIIDEFGRAKGLGKRKSASCTVFLVEGEGEVLINGRTLNNAFGRIHDRESVVWPLKTTERLDKYNVFATVHGGGTTGQAEALTLGVAKALMVHEPALKTALRRGEQDLRISAGSSTRKRLIGTYLTAGCVSRDPRRVERKKPGHLKARKMPAWVKR